MTGTTLLTLVAGLLIGALIGFTWARARGGADLARANAERDAAHDRLAEVIAERRESRAELSGQAVVKDSLDRLHDQLRELERNRASWQSQLKQQVDDVRLVGDTLRRETSALSTALRKPQVRGRWGELHLRRAVELAGLVERCDFTEQVSARGDEGTLRPDLVVHLAGGKQVVVDAKVPLDAFLDATAADDDEQRAAQLRRHARQLRAHVDTLAAKTYWEALPHSPEFVVLFVPAEAFLSHALEVDARLLDDAAARKVILSTPSTLIALLRTVAHAWTEEAMADNAREVHALGRELHKRIATVADHFDKLGRSLGLSVEHYNRAIGSLESRVLVSARKLGDLSASDLQTRAPTPIDTPVRTTTAAELLVTDAVPPVHGIGAGADPPARERAVGE
ncbi:MAG TPA: DNA recombination protein RmuC [Nocardioidaceae bacterium]|nr:DNA recombination protein RmuC [Nocardioidaceae bacterium]